MNIKEREQGDGSVRRFLALLVNYIRNYRIIASIVTVVLYSSGLVILGGFAYKEGFFGEVLEPALKENIMIPANYVRGLWSKPEQLFLDIGYKDYQALAFKREQALSEGVLHQFREDYVPGRIKWNGKAANVEVRLKGNWPDHWARDRKWSLQVKTKGDKSILGMTKFSLQHPRTRGFLNDWYLHQMLKLFGFITLKYDFVEVTINGENLGIYLVEQAMDDMLLSNNQFVDSPILRIHDHLLHYNFDPVIGLTTSHLNENYLISPIDSLNLKRNHLEGDVFFLRFNYAKNLLESFRQGRLATHQVFDIDKLAKVFAVMDLFGYHHSTAYSNIRFYYNPFTSRLEPIGRDETFLMPAKYVEGQGKRIRTIENNGAALLIDTSEYEIWYHSFFRDRKFFEKYIEALEEISERKFLDNFFEVTNQETKRALDVLYRSFPGYRFDHKTTLYQNQVYIKKLLNPIQGIEAYLKNVNLGKGSLVLEIGNIHSLPIEILGLNANGRSFSTIHKDMILQSKIPMEFMNYKRFEFAVPEDVQWTSETKASLELLYRVLGTRETKRVKVIPWPQYDEDFMQNNLLQSEGNLDGFNFLVVDRSSKEVIFRRGKWNLTRNLIIPSGFKVVAGPGTEISLSQSAKIISHSPVRFDGTEESPVTFHSVDGKGQGLVILKTKEKSILRNVVFKNLAAPNNGQWRLTGSVTFYEAPVVLDNCTFLKDRSDDGLNIVRSEFSITNSHFSNAQSNGLSIAFGGGKILDTSFADCGKDAMRFTGSEIIAERLSFKDIGGSGFVADENTRGRADYIKMENVSVGVETKGRSTLLLNSLNVSNSKIGVAVFQSKAQLGPSSVTIRGLKTNKVLDIHVVENRSTLTIDDKYIAPNRKKIDRPL